MPQIILTPMVEGYASQSPVLRKRRPVDRLISMDHARSRASTHTARCRHSILYMAVTIEEATAARSLDLGGPAFSSSSWPSIVANLALGFVER
jgi:hypothetical protein